MHNTLLVWIDPSRGQLSLVHLSTLNAYESGSEGLSAAVDISGICGLGTEVSTIRGEAPLLYKRRPPSPECGSVKGSPFGPTLTDIRALRNHDQAITRLPCGLPMT